jgi:Lar family restriction alleviation protein
MSKYGACPFCGKNAAAVDTFNSAGGKPSKFSVQCQECLAAVRWSDTEYGAREAWNNRAKGRREPANAAIGTDVFVYRNVIHARNPQTGVCYRGGPDGYKRMKKADFVKTYAACLAECSEELKAAAEAGA